jgi:hypothetical protein
MNINEFNSLVGARVKKISDVLANKGKEYGKNDCLYNFKRAAEILRTTPQHALAGMWMKHVVSVMDLIEGTLPATELTIDEKIGDAINYMILLEAVLRETLSAPTAGPNEYYNYMHTKKIAVQLNLKHIDCKHFTNQNMCVGCLDFNKYELKER